MNRWILVALVTSVAGCGAAAEPAARSGAPTSGAPTSVDTGPTVPIPTMAPNTLKPTDAATPPDTPEPATAPPPPVAGPLGPRNLPSPAVLGHGWRTFNDPGGAEQGFQGNQTWTRRRDPHQAAFEALPIGCANPLPDSALPVPRHALQGSYRNAHGGPATVLVLRFGSASDASSYFIGYGARMRACGAPRDASYQGLAVVPLWTTSDAAATVRRYTGAETFVEVAVRRGASVALLASSAGASTGTTRGDRAWTRGVAPHLAAPLA
jgi:hypothetical protein